MAAACCMIRRTLSDPTLLRAVKGSVILRNFDKLFGSTPVVDGEDDASLFDLSFPVENLDLFLSHSWQSSEQPAIKARCRRFKWLGLLFTFNLRAALISSALAAVVGFLAQRSLPGFFWSMHYADFMGQQRTTGFMCLFSASIAFILCLRYGVSSIPGSHHGLAAQVGTFLDKCCVCQTDPVKKAKAIASIATFISRSDKMMICWTNDYFTRLWFLPFCTLLLMLVAACTSLLIMAARAAWFATGLNGSISALGFMCVVMPLHNFFVVYSFVQAAIGAHMYQLSLNACPDKRVLVRQLEHFSLKHAKCHFESDRTQVEASIQEWFGASAEFEKFVRTDLRSHVHLEDHCFPWKLLVVSYLPFVWQYLDNAAYAPDSVTAIKYIWAGAGAACLVIPLTMAMLDWSVRYLVAHHQRNWTEDDKLETIWNVYFLTTDTTLLTDFMSKLFPKLIAGTLCFTVVSVPLGALWFGFILYQGSAIAILLVTASLCVLTRWTYTMSSIDHRMHGL